MSARYQPRRDYDWAAWQDGRRFGRREADCPRWLFTLRLAWWRIRDRKDYHGQQDTP